MSLGDHYYLSPDDLCFYVIEYTSKKRYDHSAENALISNLKKDMSRQGRPEWPHKNNAIIECASMLVQAFQGGWLENATIVPVPPSKRKDDPLYDDRMSQIAEKVATAEPVDIRELVVQTVSLSAAHTDNNHRHSPDELLGVYQIDETIAQPVPRRIIIVDDVITAGSHYRAMHTILSRRFPDAQIFGCFIARRVFPESDFDF